MGICRSFSEDVVATLVNTAQSCHLLHNVVLTGFVSSKRIQSHVQSSAPAPPSACSQISDLNLSLARGCRRIEPSAPSTAFYC
jgi:hypothetical protein